MGRSSPQRRVGLTKAFACRDVGVLCRAKITGETEEEVLAKAVEHAKKHHGVDLTVSQTLVKFATSKVRDEGPPPSQAPAEPEV